jgi:EAL domain-containing protein (putative c-di-GMP-specific phosphodiesterase class I)
MKHLIETISPVIQTISAASVGRGRRGNKAKPSVARLGRDEFALIFATTADAMGAARDARRFLRPVKRPISLRDRRGDLGTRLGVALYPVARRDVGALLGKVATSEDRFEPSYVGHAGWVGQEPRNHKRQALENELRRGIDANELVLHYQPLVSFKTGQVGSVEALVRWRHQERGLVPPGQFIPLAERTRLIKPLSQWVLNSALGQCHAWRKAGLRLPVTVNLSMRNLHDPKLPDSVSELLSKWDLGADSLEVEITENGVTANPQRALQVLTRLSGMGVRVAIDDFGIGYSSLSRLKTLPVELIKIDQSFVSNMVTNAGDHAIVRSVVDLGHNLGLGVVAEGVEDRATWDMLAALGCDAAQGYYVSRPMPPVDLVEWLNRSSAGAAKRANARVGMMSTRGGSG